MVQAYYCILILPNRIRTKSNKLKLSEEVFEIQNQYLQYSYDVGFCMTGGGHLVEFQIYAPFRAYISSKAEKYEIKLFYYYLFISRNYCKMT